MVNPKTAARDFLLAAVLGLKGMLPMRYPEWMQK